MVAPSPETERLAYFWQAVYNGTENRRFAVTEGGHFLLVPKVTQPSDTVVYIEGCEFPLVLRPKEDHFLLLGVCYVDGLMSWQEDFDEFYEKLERTSKTTFEIH